MENQPLKIPVNPDLYIQTQVVLNNMGLDIVVVVNAFLECVVRQEPWCMKLLDEIRADKQTHNNNVD